MADVTQIKYVSPEKLGYYDEKIKAYLAEKDKVIQDALDAEILRAKGAEEANATAAQNAQAKGEEALAHSEALAAKVGTVEDGKTVMGIIGEIQENAYDDTELRGLISDLDTNKADKTQVATDIENAVKAEKERAEGIEGGLETRLKAVEDDYLKGSDKQSLQDQITENAEAIETLNGDSSVEGSVDKKVADAINTFATQITDDGTINTFKEVLNYISTHGGEAAEMAAAIDTLEGLVGEKSVATQIAEAITAENLGQYATDEELAAAIARIVVVEGKAHEHANKALLDTYTQTEADLADAVAKKHAHANAAELDKIADGDVAKWNASEQNAKDYADGLNEALGEKVTALEEANAEGGAVATAIADAKKAGTDAQAEVDALEEVVAGKADAQTVTDLSNTVAGKADASALDALEDVVDGKADSQTVTDLANAVGTPDEGKTVVGMVNDAEARIEALEAVQHVEIENSYIDGLFQQEA